MRETLLQNPRNVMAKGYAIVRSQGKAIRSIQQITDQELQIELKDGTIDATVTQVNASINNLNNHRIALLHL